MFLAAHAALIGFQWLICVLTAAGWGYWVYWWCGRPANQSGAIPLLCAIAGWCGGCLALQDAVIFGARLSCSAPVGAAVALAGAVGWYRDYNNNRAAGPHRNRAAVILLGTVFTFQAAGLIYAGARDYYGYARQDQVNYVQLAQFLVEKPYATERAEVGLHPWLVKGIDTKKQRIGQSVANGYLAVVTGTDASQTYGTISVFFVALIAVSVAGCLLAYGACPPLAWFGGAWAGVLPGIAQMHLDGFFSQTSTVFCFVGLAWALRLARNTPRLSAIATTLFLGFLLSAYSEVYILGLALALALVATAPGLRARDKWGLAAFVTLAPWGCLSPFAANIAGFIRGQYQAAQHAEALALWHPRAGTWRGWNELFLVAPAHATALLTAAALAGAGLLVLVMVGAVASAMPGSGQRLTLALFPTAVLGALVWVSRPVFPTYALGKLMVSFSPLAVVLIVFALSLPSLRWIRAAVWLLPMLILLAAWSSWTKLAVVFRDGAGLQTMNLPSARAGYRELDAHPERTYLIIEPHGMLNSWLAYHARHASVYSSVPIGDSSMEPDFPFLQSPPAGAEIWEVSAAGVRRREP